MPNDLSARTVPDRGVTVPGTPGNLTGTVPGGYDPAYGGVPVIPDPIASAWKALGGDQAMLEQIFGLGNQYNQFNYGQHMGQIAGTPSYGNVTDLMAGKLPQDVMAQLNQGSAERGTSLGLDPNSPNVNSAYLRSLGLSSLDAQQLGQKEFGALSGLFPQAAPFNPSSFFTSPEDIQAASAAANVSAAAPNPRAAAMEEERRMLEALAAGRSSLPPTVAPGGGGPSGSLNGPSNTGPQTMVGSGPSQTLNGPASPSFDAWMKQTFPNGIPQNTGQDSLTQILRAGAGQGSGGINQTLGSTGYLGPLLDPTGGNGLGLFNSAMNDPWIAAMRGSGGLSGGSSGAFAGGQAGNFGDFIGALSGGLQGGMQGGFGNEPDPLEGYFSGGFHGASSFDPFAGTFAGSGTSPNLGYTGGYLGSLLDPTGGSGSGLFGSGMMGNSNSSSNSDLDNWLYDLYGTTDMNAIEAMMGSGTGFEDIT